VWLKREPDLQRAEWHNGRWLARLQRKHVGHGLRRRGSDAGGVCQPGHVYATRRLDEHHDRGRVVMRAVRCALIALTIALPVSAQTPAQLDSMRVELVRCVAFGKGADTQATKALNELAAGDTAAARVEMVRSRGMVRALITQCDKSL